MLGILKQALTSAHQDNAVNSQTIDHSQMYFVFGSNLSGKHGKGAALTAKRFFGAANGVGEGLTGQAYALPTKNAQIQVRTIWNGESRGTKSMIDLAEREQILARVVKYS